MQIGAALDQVVQQDEQAVTGTIYQPSGDAYLAADGSECTLTVQGKESKRYRRAKDAQTRRMLRSKKNKLEPADIRANRVELVIAVLTGWHGWEDGDKPAELNEENAKQLLRVDHILDQAEELIEGHADFFKKSSQS